MNPVLLSICIIPLAIIVWGTVDLANRYSWAYGRWLINDRVITEDDRSVLLVITVDEMVDR